MFFEEESDVKSADAKFVLEKAAKSNHKGYLFTRKPHPAQFNYALDFIRIGCKVKEENVETTAMAPPPTPLVLDRPSLDMLHRVAITSSANQRIAASHRLAAYQPRLRKSSSIRRPRLGQHPPSPSTKPTRTRQMLTRSTR